MHISWRFVIEHLCRLDSGVLIFRGVKDHSVCDSSVAINLIRDVAVVIACFASRNVLPHSPSHCWGGLSAILYMVFLCEYMACLLDSVSLVEVIDGGLLTKVVCPNTSCRQNHSNVCKQTQHKMQPLTSKDCVQTFGNVGTNLPRRGCLPCSLGEIREPLQLQAASASLLFGRSFLLDKDWKGQVPSLSGWNVH